jgi:hypothetical protein
MNKQLHVIRRNQVGVDTFVEPYLTFDGFHDQLQQHIRDFKHSKILLQEIWLDRRQMPDPPKLQQGLRLLEQQQFQFLAFVEISYHLPFNIISARLPLILALKELHLHLGIFQNKFACDNVSRAVAAKKSRVDLRIAFDELLMHIEEVMAEAIFLIQRTRFAQPE